MELGNEGGKKIFEYFFERIRILWNIDVFFFLYIYFIVVFEINFVILEFV